MYKKFKLKILMVLIILVSIIGASIYHKTTINNLQKDKLYWQNKSIELDSVKYELEGINSKLTFQVNEIITENNSLDSLLHKRNEKISQNTTVIGKLIEQLRNVKTTSDTIYVNNNKIYIQKFIVKKSPFYIEGSFYINYPYTINFNKIEADINLDVTITENKYGEFKTYISSPYKNLLINDINSKIVPYNQSFWDKIKLGSGVIIAPEYAALIGNIGYNNITIITGYGTTGLVFGGTYWFK